MRLVLLGPPGAGKGTHAVILAKDFNLLHIATGDMLRDAVKKRTVLGVQAKEYMEKGALVPDELVIAMVKEQLVGNVVQNGFVLDGFPRTPEQARSLDRSLRVLQMPLDLVLHFKTSADVVIRRLSGRRVCMQCGRVFHVTNMRPQLEGICDACQGKLIQRMDDNADTIKNRLRVYEAETAPLIGYYEKEGKLVEVAGDLEVEMLQVELIKLFKIKGFASSRNEEVSG